MGNISTKEYLKKHLVTIKNAIVVNEKTEKKQVSTTEYLLNHEIHPLKALEVEDKKQDVITKKIRNIIRISIFLLLMVSFSPLSTQMNFPQDIQSWCIMGLLADVFGIQIIKKS